MRGLLMKVPNDSRARWTVPLLWLASAVAAQAAPVVGAFERFHRGAATVDGGLLLLNELNCVACHASPEAWRERLTGRGKIALADVGSRLSEAALRAFISEPHGVKPGTTMPAVARDDAVADAIAAYLATLKREEKWVPAGDAARGKTTFESVGCVACHGVPDTSAKTRDVPIGLAPHYERDALVAFLSDPLRSRPGGRMPKTELSVREAADVAAYLQNGPKPSAGAGRPRSADVGRGRTEFTARNCVACHTTGEAAEAKPARALIALRPTEGCLAAQPASGVPQFSLDEGQRAAVTAALRAIRENAAPVSLTAEQRVAAKFEQLNCYACHEWRGRGGVAPERAKFFAATDAAVESLGEIGHLPPKLDQAGRKLTPAWLEKLLWGPGGGVRPYMTARMPKFGVDAAVGLVPLLTEACRPAQPQEIDVSGGKGHQRFATGRTLLGTGAGGLGCVACHGVKTREPSGVRAINLTSTAQRLQPEYFKALLLDPQVIQPGTIMPPLLAGRANADKEIESMWTYFKELDQSEVLPDGLAVAGSFELKPEEERRPIVFRTFLEGAGTQAIAVGFPQGVHAAFDAFEVRWALAWRGRFLDAQSNWEERPMKPVKALGEPRHVFPAALSLAQLRSASEPWPKTFGSYAGFVFKGYRLSADGVPTFRYGVAGIDVEDTLRPDAVGKGFRRTVVLRREPEAETAERGTWYFRGMGAGAALPREVEWKSGVATIEEDISW